MQACMWRLTDQYAVLYTGDRATLKAVLGYARFPHKDISRATTYAGKNGKVFAWQFTFPMALWNGMVRHLGRAAVTFLDEEKPTRAARKPAASTPKAPAPPVKASQETRPP